MKKISYVFAAVLISGLAFLNSCSKSSDNTTPVDQTPAINFTAGTGLISSDATVTVNDSIFFGITAFSNTNSKAKLITLTVTRVFNNQPAPQDFPINSNSLNIVLHTKANSQVGPEKWIFKVTDNNSQTKEISLTVTTVPVTSNGPITAWTMKILGAQGNSTGSSFASINGNIYQLADAKSNAAKIDWLYYYGATNFATLASPKDSSAAQVFNDPTNGLKTWAIRNNTLFKKVTDVIDWNSITNDAVIVAQTASGVTNTKINSLAVNDILSFIAVNGKKGMIKVESISGTTDGTITISVKVQQ
jgi:hypothetical protein